MPLAGKNYTSRETRRDIFEAMKLLREYNKHLTKEILRTHINGRFFKGKRQYTAHEVYRAIDTLIDMGVVEMYKVGKYKCYKLLVTDYEDPVLKEMAIYLPEKLYNYILSEAKAQKKAGYKIVVNLLERTLECKECQKKK